MDQSHQNVMSGDFNDNVTVRSSAPESCSHEQVAQEDIVSAPADSNVTMPVIYFLLTAVCFWYSIQFFKILSTLVIRLYRHGWFTRRLFMRMCIMAILLRFIVVLLQGAPYIVLLASYCGVLHMYSKVPIMNFNLAYMFIIYPIVNGYYEYAIGRVE